MENTEEYFYKNLHVDNDNVLCVRLKNESTPFCENIIDFVISNISSYGDVKEIKFVTSSEKLPKQIFEKVLELRKVVADKIDINFVVRHSYEDDWGYEERELKWDIATIVRANSGINGVCDFIKQNNLSPFEALAYIHDYVSTITRYHESHLLRHEWYNKDQFFASAYMDIPELVCMGYSSLMKEIIDNLGMPGLDCEIISVQFEHLKKDIKGAHTRCFIKIKDDKYGLDQTMFDDPTWDNDDNLPHKYCHFAMPNNSFDLDVSKIYDYRTPYKMEKSQFGLVYTNENIMQSVYNNSKKQVTQFTVETAYFNMLCKKYPDKKCREVYNDIAQMTKLSYDEQVLREYDGNIKTEKPKLSKLTAIRLYKINHKNLTINATQNYNNANYQSDNCL